MLASSWMRLTFGFLVLTGLFPSAFASEIRYSDSLSSFFDPPPEWRDKYGSYRSPLRFYDGRPVRTAADWRRRRAEIIARWHRLMGPWPAVLKRPGLMFLSQEKREDFIQHKVRVEIARDHWEEGYLLIPNGRGPFPAVVVPYYEPESSIGRGAELRDFGHQLTRRGFVTLSIGSPGGVARDPKQGTVKSQPLSFLAHVAANCHQVLAQRTEVDRRRIGIVGHSYGGKWAMFGACLYEKFACGVWSDPGIVFDETRPNVNYWERWYLGSEIGRQRPPGTPSDANPRTGAYRRMIEGGFDLHEMHALMAPRPFLVSGGAEDQPERWVALNHTIAVNRLLRARHRVGMTNREGHNPTPESNEQIYQFFEDVLQPGSTIRSRRDAGRRH